MASRDFTGKTVASQATSQDDNSPVGVTKRGDSPPLPSHEHQKTIADLPNELLIRIFEYLDTPPASTSLEELKLEPRLDLTASPVTPLKNVACVSTLWREAVLPILFRHAQVVTLETETIAGNVATYFEEFLHFLIEKNLQKAVLSFALVCSNKDFLTSAYSAVSISYLSGIWGKLFNVLDPDDVLIVASVEAMAFLTACGINLDARDFFDAPCQYLRLSRPSRPRVEVGQTSTSNVEDSLEGLRDHTSKHTMAKKPVDLWSRTEEEEKVTTTGLYELHIEQAEAVIPDDADILESQSRADAEELFKRPWTKLLLNEGSSLKVFARPDFWEFEPPSVSVPSPLPLPTKV